MNQTTQKPITVEQPDGSLAITPERLLEMLDLIENLTPIVAASHYKCDYSSGECYAEQYGDGDESQHHLIQHAEWLLSEAKGEV